MFMFHHKLLLHSDCPSHADPTLCGWLPSKRQLAWTAAFLLGWQGLTRGLHPVLLRFSPKYIAMSTPMQQCVPRAAPAVTASYSFR
jgi:hypothetical protein